jgi:large subunit ribosomal protein L24
VPARVKKGDTVMVISGKDRGKTGEVLSVDPKKDRVVIEGLNIQKRHVRPRPPEDAGGVIDTPGPIHLSNVAPIDPVDKGPTRVRFQDGQRIAVRSGESLDA